MTEDIIGTKEIKTESIALNENDADTLSTSVSTLSKSIFSSQWSAVAESVSSSASSHSYLRTDKRKSTLKLLETSNGRAKKALEQLTINKLDVKSLDLVGRDTELSTIRSRFLDTLLCAQEEKTSPSPLHTDKRKVTRELVFIRGYSGIGKSKLAQSIQKEVSSSNGVYVEGKYAITSTDKSSFFCKPYSGLAQAFGALCNKLKDHSSSDTLAKLIDTVNNTMKEEVQLLMGLIPELRILSRDDNTEEYISIPSEPENEHKRWKHAFRMLNRMFSLHFSSIVMVLDDLHRADAPSLDLMDFLISDVENRHPLMLIGCYRSEEVEENGILGECIQTLQEKQERFGFQITCIQLQNLDADSVNRMVMKMLSIDDGSKTEELSAVCFKRTLGNPFVVVEFMKMLQVEGFLDFSLGLMKWVWDVSKIEGATMSAANVVDLLQSRMKKLSEDTQLLLQYAACLGTSFSLSTLKLVWENHAIGMSEGINPNVTEILEVALEEMLIEANPKNSKEFRWVHDSVQEVALSLSDLLTPSFLFDLGICLYQGLDGPELERELFNVADLINNGNVPYKAAAGLSSSFLASSALFLVSLTGKGKATHKSELSKLNLHAAKKAHQMAAYQSCAHFVSNGIKLLPSDKWAKHRDLALELYSLGGQANVAVANVDVANEYFQELFSQKSLTPLETIELHTTKLEILSTLEARFKDAVDYSLQLLKELGHRSIWRPCLVPLQALMLLKKMVKRLEELPVQHFKDMELLEDPKQEAIVNVLTKLAMVAWKANNLFLSILCNCQVIQLTLEHGLHHCSAGQCVGCAMLSRLVLKNDLVISSHICDIGFAIQTRFGRRGAGNTILTSTAFTLCLVKPLHEVLPKNMEGYMLGMRDGDNYSAMTNLLQHFVTIPYVMGRPLGRIAEDCQRISPQFEEINAPELNFFLQALWQLVLNLQLPPSSLSKKLEGELFNVSSESTMTPGMIAVRSFGRGNLLLFFADHETRAKELCGEEKGKTFSELMQGQWLGRIDTFHQGIAWFDMARKKKGNRKYKAKALKIKKLVSKWAKEGDPNAQHWAKMLDAEHEALKKKYLRADQFYKEAITHACRTGHLQHAALFNERFAEFQLEVYKDEDNGKYYMEKAIMYYTEWGAIGKAEHLKNKIGA